MLLPPSWMVLYFQLFWYTAWPVLPPYYYFKLLWLYLALSPSWLVFFAYFIFHIISLCFCLQYCVPPSFVVLEPILFLPVIVLLCSLLSIYVYLKLWYSFVVFPFYHCWRHPRRKVNSQNWTVRPVWARRACRAWEV